MKNTLYALGLLLIASTPAFAADVVGTATATIVQPVAVSETQSLSFGNVAPGSSIGTVTVAPTGTVSTSNVDSLGGSPTNATFAVTGYNSSALSITLPSSATLSSGGDTMTVDTFVHDAGASPALSGGSLTVNIGATLNVGANQATGSYTGTYTVTVNYQ